MVLLNDETSARFGVLLVAFSPFNIYFASFYTESVFLFFSLAAMLSAHKKHWCLAGLTGMILSGVHPNGVMVIFPLTFMAIIQYRNGELYWPKLFYLCLIPLGLLGFMVYLHYQIGDALGFIHNQIYWGRPGATVLTPSYIILLFIYYTYNGVLLVTSFFLMYELANKKFLAEFLFFFTTLAPAILSGTLIGMARYSATLFTFYLALVVWSYQKKYLMLGLLLLEALYFGVYTSAWINSMNVLM